MVIAIREKKVKGVLKKHEKQAKTLRETVGERIEELMRRRFTGKRPQADFADALTKAKGMGTYQPDVSNLIHGKVWPTPEMLCIIADVLGVSVEKIISVP